MSTRLMPGLLLATLLTAAFVVACRLAAFEAADRDGVADGGVAEQLLGGSRLLVGDLCFEQADLYLHRGMPHLKPEAFTNRWLQRLSAQVSPRVIQHRESVEGLRDVLPWVSLAARFASTNSDFILTQAYLLERTGDVAGALEAFRRGRLALPQDPALPLNEAQLQIRLGHWQEAAEQLERCARLAGPRPVSPDGIDLLAEACFLQSLLQERTGATRAAAECLAQAVALKPEWYGGYTNRLAALRAGAATVPPIDAVLNTFRRAVQSNPLCHHDDGD